MKKIIMTVGLPGSGKTTWAKEYLIKNTNTIRINKDDLRLMLNNGVHSKGKESFILEMRNYITTQALLSGKDVIIDDTNLNPIHEKKMREIAKECNAIVEIKDFTNIPLDICIARDGKRVNAVGSNVIKTMYHQYLRKRQPATIPYDTDLPDAVIFDIDGTLALFADANPYDRDFTLDTINVFVATILKLYLATNNPPKIIIVSGRKDIYKEQTQKWFEMHDISYDYLYMRPTQPNGIQEPSDVLIKENIYNTYIKDQYNILAVFDDRLKVCRLWYSLGLPLFKVGDPDADF